MPGDKEGVHHQTNAALLFDADSLQLLDSQTGFSYPGHASHSFNQFIVTDGVTVFRTDHGDAYPRGVQISSHPVKNGDVDDDGFITAADARLALRRAVELESFSKGSRAYVACNVDRDNAVTSSDARSILRAAVGIDDPELW